VAAVEGELSGQARKGAARRAAIVDAALTVFSQRGFRDGSLADVAEKVDLSPAGILYHFGSKEELLLAVIAERDRRASEPSLAGDGEVRGMDALKASVRFAEQSEGERGLAALHTVLQAESFEPDAPTHEYFLLRSRFLRSTVAQLLRQAQDEGDVRADVDCDAKANEVVAFLEGAAVVWLMDPEVSLVDLYRSYFDDLARSLGPTPGGGR
jgi:AcrR family transcriptional regulator